MNRFVSLQLLQGLKINSSKILNPKKLKYQAELNNWCDK
mgnify:CR=1 FL=1